MTGFIDGSLGSWQFVQAGDLVFLTVSFVAGAYVVCAAIEAGVHFASSSTDRWGFYADYANYSTMGTLLYLWEASLIVAWNVWAFFYVILAIVFAADVWGQLDRRHIENQKTIGFETPFEWTYAIKAQSLLMVLSLVMVITGFSLGDTADELIGWVSRYSDDTDNKAKDSDYDTTATHDILLHMTIASFSYLLFFLMTLAGYIWAWSFLNIENAGADLECEINPNNDYSALPAIVANITSYETCLENVDAIFDVGDQDNDNYISMCEDANFQHFAGQEWEFAKKFAGAYTREYAKIVCNGRFRY
jgi:hypothetical protein